MYSPPNRSKIRQTVHVRIRKRLRGKPARPRIAVFRSLKHIYAQVIDDLSGRTLAAAGSRDKELGLSYGGNIEAAKKVGKLLGERALKAGVGEAIFDRGGHRYHGRVKSLADAAREAGLKF